MDEARGHWSEPNTRGLRHWVGKAEWTDRHGDAVVHYLLGRAKLVENATLPDGTVIPRVETWSAVEHDIWRRPDGIGGYVVGRISISDGGVTFEDDVELDARWKASPADDEDALPMARALARDPEFMARIQEDAFAEAVYASFCNREWRHEDGTRHSISWRRSGGMVADLRQRGESYTDWYPWTSAYIQDTPEARDADHIYARLGWTELTREQALADQEAAVALLEEIEARPQGEPRSDSYRPRGIEEREDLYARAYRAWETGRATDRELAFVSERIVWDHEEPDLSSILGPKP